LVDEALAIAAKVAGQSRVASLVTKRAVNAAFETTLTQGVATERALFLSLFGTADQIEGMTAFVEKRKPRFAAR
jgi:enoyl-CoA hydratase